MVRTGARDYPWKSLALLGLLLLPQAPSRAAAAELKASQVYAKSVPSVCTVITMANGKPVSLGSGFVVSVDGLVATNRHVVDRATDILVKCGKAKPVAGQIAGPSGSADLVLIRTPLRLRPLPISAESPEKIIGQQVFVIGNPEGLEGTISSGLISGVRPADGVPVIQISAPISHGSSGGPVILGSGAVIGIATAQLAEGQNLNFALPASLLRELMVDAGKQASVENGSAEATFRSGEWKDIPSAFRSRSFWTSMDWSAPDARAPFTRLTPFADYDPAKHRVAGSRVATKDVVEFLGRKSEIELLVREVPEAYPKGFRLNVSEGLSPEYCREVHESLEAELGAATVANDLSWPGRELSATVLRRQWDIGQTRIHYECMVFSPMPPSSQEPFGALILFAWHQSAWKKDQPVSWIRCTRTMGAVSRAANGQVIATPAKRVPDVIFGIDEYAGAVYRENSRAGNATITDAYIRVLASGRGREDDITIDRRTGSYNDRVVITDSTMTTTGTTTGECAPFDANAKRF